MYAFPPFALIGKVLQKVRKDKAELILIAPLWSSQSWFPQLCQLAIQNPVQIPCQQNLLTNPQGQIHPLVLNKSLALAAWRISGQPWVQARYQQGLKCLSQIADGQGQSIITNHPEITGVVLENRLIPPEHL